MNPNSTQREQGLTLEQLGLVPSEAQRRSGFGRSADDAGRGSDDRREGPVPNPGLRSTEPASSLRILFLVSAHNGLSQRAWLALTELGHEVSVAVVKSAIAMEAAVREHDPELIVCPFLKTMIPESIWSRCRCLIVHPGPRGDRGPSSLDWAIELRMREWGVTVLEASGVFDAGDVWATSSFAMREVGKSSLYRHEVRRAAIEALVQAIGRVLAGGSAPKALDPGEPRGRARALMSQQVRAIDWGRNSTEVIARKIHAGEGHPGVLDVIDGTEFHLFGAHSELGLNGRPGDVIAQRAGAICRATVDGAVWITHLKRRDTPTESFFKLPAMRALSLAGLVPDVPQVTVARDARLPAHHTYRDIAYQEHGAVGYLSFEFYNGAMSTEQCRRLRDAYAYARSRSKTRVIVLLGGSDYFSNGIHLNVIEAADDPAVESWRNLHAITDLVRDIIQTDSHLVISALRGDAAAGGVPLAVAADYTLAREDTVLNPYYQHMGGLYGSEYWTYLLPRRVGAEMTARLTGAPFTPIGARHAVRIGLLDAAVDATPSSFHNQTRRLAEGLSSTPSVEYRLEQKRREREHDELLKPLHAYHSEEMARCQERFFGPDPSYHQARRRFVYKIAPAHCETPQRLDDGSRIDLGSLFEQAEPALDHAA
jgi:putative two-component system protein, hydrogenase maturation factor HypX/HoxX